MYKLLLILRYLRRKLAPMFAALAVTLCTAMVIIVISVMGGFLQMWRDSAKKLSGEVRISAGIAGFPHYEQMLAALRDNGDVEAASAVIYTFCIMKIEDATRADDAILKMEVVGIRPAELAKVVAFEESLYWSPGRVEADIRKNEGFYPVGARPAKRDKKTGQVRWLDRADLVEAAMAMKPPEEWQTDLPGMITGIAVHGAHRDKDGEFSLYRNRTVGNATTVTVVPITDRGGLLEQAVRKFVVVNEVKSGFMEFDQNRVYVPFEVLQEMLTMQPLPETDDNNKPTGKISPGRASWILIKGKPGLELAKLKASVAKAIEPIAIEHKIFTNIDTWEEQHATILGAVEKEKFLLVFLFAIISLVAFVMVATTFYNIVLEKTRDVGVLRALGASHFGVAGLFLGYGLAIGIVGACVGFLLAWGIVANLNEIQDFLEKDLGLAVYCLFYALGGVVVGIGLFIALGKWVKSSIGRWRGWAAASVPFIAAGLGWLILRASPALMEAVQKRFSVKIWDAQIYYFDRIPAKLNWTEVIVIIIAAILSAVLGSLIPAIVASRLDPVEAIRYE